MIRIYIYRIILSIGEAAHHRTGSDVHPAVVLNAIILFTNTGIRLDNVFPPDDLVSLAVFDCP